MPVKYKLFDLIVESEIPIVEAPGIDLGGAADVFVRFGEISVSDAAGRPDTVHYSSRWKMWRCILSGSHLIFNTPVALFEIRDGSTITVQPIGDRDVDMIRAYLMGTALGILQAQRGRFPVHGGSVAIGGKAAVISGVSGAGKSTLTSSLVHRGHQFLADDVSAVSLSSAVPQVIPAYPQRKLLRDACLQLGYNPDELPLIDGLRDKHAIREDPMWHGSRLPLGWIVEITFSEADKPVQIQPVTGVEKLGLLLRNLYRPWLFNDKGVAPDKMKELLTIASAAKMFSVNRPEDSQCQDEITESVIGAILSDR